MTRDFDEPSGFYRHGLAVWLDLLSARLEGTQTRQKLQIATVGSLLSYCNRAAAEAVKARDVEELIVLQAKLWQESFEIMTAYWVEASQAAGADHAETAKRMQAQAQPVLQKMHETAQAVSKSPLPMITTLQPLVNSRSPSNARSSASL